MDYAEGKQTYEQLAVKYDCSTKTIQRKIDSVIIKQKKSFEFLANVLIDTTYFGRTFGVMVFKNSLSKEVLLKYYVKVETNKQYYATYSGDTRSRFPVISVHYLFKIDLADVKLILFS